MDPVVVPLIASAVTAIVTLVGFILQRGKLQNIHLEMNGRMSLLLETTERAARAEAEALLLSAAAQKAKELLLVAAAVAKDLINAKSN